eukprot:1155386-Pyramimonas_sp.AAC.1
MILIPGFVRRPPLQKGLNREAFLGNSVEPEFFKKGFVNLMKGMAGKWSHFFNKGTVARVNADSQGKLHATHDGIDNKKVFGLPRPLGARHDLKKNTGSPTARAYTAPETPSWREPTRHS